MTVNINGLNLTDKELRAFLIMKVGLLNFSCYHSCSECCFLDDGNCSFQVASDLFDVLFKGLIL